MPQQFALDSTLIANAVPLATVDPISQGVGTVTSAWVRAADFSGVMALVQTGVMGAAATLDAKLQWADDNVGTNVADSGKSITQIVKASGDNKQACIMLPKWQLGKPWVRLSMTVGGAASLVAGSLFGIQSLYGATLPAALGPNVVQIVP